MKNVNRDYLVKVDAKTADIVPPRDMKFYVTDIYTCNIFFQLTINDTNSSFVNAPNEDASNYTLTLRILKPDDTPKEIVATFMYQSGNHFYYVADLAPDYTDVLGIYDCELFIDANVVNEYGVSREERSTTEPFQYEVEKSIFSDLDEVIEGDPDYPLLIDLLATKDYVNNMVENLESFGYATRDYVNQVIADMDFTDYATKDYVDRAMSNMVLTDYATKEYVNEYVNRAISNIEFDDVDLSDYATKDYVDEAIENIDLTDYTTHDYVDQAIANIDLSDYATESYVNDKIGDIDSILDYLNGEVI